MDGKQKTYIADKVRSEPVTRIDRPVRGVPLSSSIVTRALAVEIAGTVGAKVTDSRLKRIKKEVRN